MPEHLAGRLLRQLADLLPLRGWQQAQIRQPDWRARHECRPDPAWRTGTRLAPRPRVHRLIRASRGSFVEQGPRRRGGEGARGLRRVRRMFERSAAAVQHAGRRVRRATRPVGDYLDPSPEGPRSVAAGLDQAGCLKIAFSVSDSACGAFGSPWLLLEVCDPRPGSFAIPAAASTNRAQDGVVVLEHYEPDVQVTGRFTAGNLGGTFDALFCGSTSCVPDPGATPD